MIHLRSLARRDWPERLDADFPFNVPVIRALDEIRFDAPVTFLVGENGSGKSTLLEALACAVGSVTVGSESVTTDPSLAPLRELARHLKLTWAKRTRRGFFLRAEDFFGFARSQAKIRAEMQAELKRVDEEYKDRSETAKGFARMPFAGELQAMRSRYGEGLEAHSHGESFLALFQSRFVPDGLYLLDEPEAPLSPIRQLGFLSLLKDMLDRNAQFIIATHSPIIMAYPEATILHFDGGTITQVDYEGLEHVTLTRAFLNNPEAFLRHI
ncbi:MAG: AAA family ATPase [Chloroflexota bacterium]